MRSSPLLAASRERGADGGQPNETSVPRPRFRWSTRVLVPASLVGGMAVLLLGSAWSSLAPALTVQTVLAVLKTVTTQAPGTVLVQATGWLESDPYLVQVTSLTNGVIEEILVLEGDAVTAGQVLARLVPDDARLAHQGALAERDLRRATVVEARTRLTAAQVTWENPIDRELRVATASANLAEIRARIARVHQEIERQQVVLEQAERTQRRMQELGAARVSPVAEVEEAQTAFRSQTIALQELRHTLAEATAAEARHQAELHAAQQHLALRTEERRELEEAEAALLGAQASLAVAEVAVDDAKLRVDRLHIRAPSDGLVVSRYKSPGDRVMLGGDSERAATLFSIYDPRSLQVRVDVPLVDAAKIAVDQPCEVVSDVLSERRFPGRVTRILHRADIQKNTLEVKVAIDDPAPELRPDMLARVRFLAPAQPAAAEPTAAVFVPSDSLRDDHVWVVSAFDGSRGAATPRSVRKGREMEGWTEVEGVQPGDLVIRPPLGDLRPGQRVRLAK